MKSNKEQPKEDMTVTITLEDDTEVECDVITILTVDKKDYIALLYKPEGAPDEDAEVWFYGYKENMADSNEEPELIYIDDDEEYEAVADAFDEYLDEAEFDAMD